ncbi:MAG: LacI family DNA-binding transcriptional regulator [Ruminococcus sp.]|uniref:LacI family DNA-binding transcriptional regulator n=1 Tax=Ruminococcus sp. TaxID=41978 RepID=UPI002872B7E6|nr:LacI family DNA-binding transcriptional regulator [Ruminococcus sp.]MBQ3286057.1 LacI family DNA-binding transcriptional regulator [Ruminococcus sp.]
MNKGSKPTMKDVAHECGLSLATVSKVINGLPVGKVSRQKVEAAIDKLGYQVNTYARALKSNKTYSVALVMPSLKHPFFAHLTDELIACLTREGYHSILMITNYDPKTEQKCFSLVKSNQADGVIALTYSPDLEVDQSIPIVTIDRHLGEDIPCVSSDNYRGGELAAKKLIELGCKKLLFVRITSKIQGEPNKRRAGFESVCQAQGIAYDTLLFNDDEPEEPIYRFLDEHISDGHIEYDGIFCNSDILAKQVILFLGEKNISVPDQVQIIGYDGIIDRFTNQYVCSTIEQPIAQMAQAAVTLMMNPVETTEGMNVMLSVRYVPGGTTKD